MVHTRYTRGKKPITYGRQLVIGGLVLTGTFLLGAATWYVTRLPSMTIQSVAVSGGITISGETVKAASEAALEGNYFALIPKRFVYLYPEELVSAAVLSVPRVSGVTFDREETTLRVQFEEFAPYALWCEANYERCLFIDEQGYAFAEAPQLKGGSLLRFVVEDAVLLPQQQIPHYAEVVRAVQLAIDIEKQFGYRVTDITLKDNKDRTLKLSGGAELLTTTAIDDELTKDNLATVLKTEKFQDLQGDNFAYIDLRFGNKVFVSKYGEQSTSTASTTIEAEAVVE